MYSGQLCVSHDLVASYVIHMAQVAFLLKPNVYMSWVRLVNYREHQPAYVTNEVGNTKPTITTEL